VGLLSSGSISGPGAKAVFEEMFNTGKPASEIIARKGLSQISDADEIDGTIGQIVAENPKAVEDYKAGKDTAIKFLVGQVMKATRGRANPQMATELLKKKLEE
jgi:aspartyl-tRNA(Asn)/glutamyl-tRNA(Gln) amidotransferase subunit B